MGFVKILLPRKGQKHIRARWTNPKTRERDSKTFNPLDFTDEERELWIARKEEELAKANRLARATHSGLLIRDQVDPMLGTKTLRPSTLKLYRGSLERFCAWGEANNCYKTSQVTREKLNEFRTALLTKMGLEVSTANKVKRNVVSLLLYLYEKNQLPECSREDIRFGMRGAKEQKKQKPLVEPKRLLEAFDGELVEMKLFVRVLLLTGMRVGELLNLEYRNVKHLAYRNCIELDAEDTKTNSARAIWLDESPSVSEVFSYMICGRLLEDSTRVWSLTKNEIDVAKRRVIKAGHPKFTWQALRRTCGSYLTCAPGIYGAASAFNSAKRLGHSVAIAERFYVGAVRGIPFEAKTLEEAMGIAEKEKSNGQA